MLLCRNLKSLSLQNSIIDEGEAKKLLAVIKTMPMLTFFAYNHQKPIRELQTALNHNKENRERALTFALAANRRGSLPSEVIGHMFHNFFYQPPGTHSDAGSKSYFDKPLSLSHGK